MTTGNITRVTLKCNLFSRKKEDGDNSAVPGVQSAINILPKPVP